MQQIHTFAGVCLQNALLASRKPLSTALLPVRLGMLDDSSSVSTIWVSKTSGESTHPAIAGVTQAVAIRKSCRKRLPASLGQA